MKFTEKVYRLPVKKLSEITMFMNDSDLSAIKNGNSLLGEFVDDKTPHTNGVLMENVILKTVRIDFTRNEVDFKLNESSSHFGKVKYALESGDSIYDCVLKPKMFSSDGGHGFKLISIDLGLK